MAEEEYFEWRLFFPLTSNDENIQTEIKTNTIVPFTVNTKLNMLSIAEEKYSHRSSFIDIYYLLQNADVCLKVHDIAKLNSLKIEIEIRNRHKEQPPSLIQHWSIYEIKYPRSELPDKILNRLDRTTIEKINEYLQMFIDKDNLVTRTDLSFIQIRKTMTTWHMNDSDRKIDETDIYITINDNVLEKEKNNSFYIPKHWRTLSIQTSDYDQLIKTLTTLQIEDDKDLLDYFSLLTSQTCFNSFPSQHQQQLLPIISAEKAYLNLLTMSYAAFIELIQRIHRNQTYTE
ncbi:unnamed protein product [Rotaria magnacalcarata]|uniref:Uncharacterized protein n=1 Tax=Rotaria magnacalcarata TaxID=392030 RepID=A0A816Z9T0_9BILA|nr:unnamed protein product [Rotaria magnacalcarata]CAF1601161.1 unnamed protein product [Rotaria magnacalcarata]CAF2039730.1 unnamed protein product [Rotaria magnacalcarata]CAF2199545.1 unnamed protein product [Rotaria magnacalcarata]CAF2216658.1 unnamed protein product [Rotaria magnacalcarata]